MGSHCKFCGSSLQEGVTYCLNCGKAVSARQAGAQQPEYSPQNTGQNPPQPRIRYTQPTQPTPYHYPTPKTSGAGWKLSTVILILIAAALILCCIAVSLTAIAASGNNSWEQFNGLSIELPFGVVIQSPFEVMRPADRDNQVKPTTPAVQMGAKSILVDYTSQWKVEDTDQYQTDKSQQGAWAIGIKHSDLTVVILTPQQPDSGASMVTIKIKIITRSAQQVVGVRCHFQDENNYYQVELKDKSFAIGKVINGALTPLTSPYWKDSQFIDANGFMGGANVAITCSPFGIGLTINGMGETPLIPDLTASLKNGKIALSISTTSQDTDDFYGLVRFEDFQVKSSK